MTECLNRGPTIMSVVLLHCIYKTFRITNPANTTKVTTIFMKYFYLKKMQQKSTSYNKVFGFLFKPESSSWILQQQVNVSVVR